VCLFFEIFECLKLKASPCIYIFICDVFVCDITDFTSVDLLFLESSEVLFRVSVALLEEHQDQLLYCDSFEEIMEYLKV